MSRHPEATISFNTNVSHITELSTRNITGEETMPSYIVAVVHWGDESRLSPLSGFHPDQYTLVRLSNVGDANIADTFDKEIKRVNEVPSIQALSDGSWEILVLKPYVDTLYNTLGILFPGLNVDMKHNPFKPTAENVEFWGLDKAKKLYADWFGERANKIAEEGWPVSAAWYSDRLTGKPTYCGFLDSIEDAIYLLEACFQGNFVHLSRGLREGEAAISGNVFVWEANSTGITCWRDGME